MDLTIFLNLASLFKQHQFRLWMVGGTSRDYLSNIPFFEFDLATDATPLEMKKFLPSANYHFAHYGTVKHFIDGIKVDITTLREEAAYLDARHPHSVRFVKEISADVLRRDFTINGIYIDDQLRVFDFVNGVEDLNQRCLKMIGNPYLRLQEDPLRILRALRFHHLYQLVFDPWLLKALVSSFHFIELLNIQKRNEELMKMSRSNPDKARELLMSFGMKDIPF
jgi:tRNA nucleotidyltransferase (CCA-adding enzyme)